MIMESAVFNFNRFRQYYRSDFLNCVRNYGISFLVLCTMAVTTDIFNGLFSFAVTGGHEWHGMIEQVRFVMFFIFLMVLIISSPAKLYGYVTDKKQGTAFLMLPVSRFEKYLSMVLNACVITPLLFIFVYLGFDLLVCLIDPTCGVSMLHRLFVDIVDFRQNLVQSIPMEELREMGEANTIGLINSISPAFTPWLLVDDVIGAAVVFLLGALIFKSAKAGKTLGSVIVIALSLEMILSPIIGFTMFSKLHPLLSSGADVSLDLIQEQFPFVFWTIRHLALADTVSDTITNCLLLFFVWLRFKNLKH